MSQDEREWGMEEKQAYFPIRILSTKTGVNSVTLRAWERRYGLLKPKRTEKGHRLYSEEDVTRVDDIVRWINQGVAVSKVRALLDQNENIENVIPADEWLEWQAALVHMSLHFEEDKIEHLYQQIFSQYPPLVAIQNWILPSLKQLGVSVHGRFCEAVLTRSLTNRLSSLKNQHTAAPILLITGLSGQQALWCYMTSAILSDHGYSCRVLPNMSSDQDWQDLIKGINPTSVVAFCESELASRSAELMASLAEWGKPISLIGASFWLAVNSKKMTSFKQVSVHSEALEGVAAILDKAALIK